MCFTRISLLGKFNGLRVHLANLLRIRSRRSCHETFLIVPYDSGKPRYLDGKEPLGKPKVLRMLRWVIPGVLRKKTWDLRGLTSSPDAFANWIIQFLKTHASWIEGCPMSMVSSTNFWCVCLSIPSWIWRPQREPKAAWWCRSLLSPSAIRMKRKGDRGSPCWIPRDACKILEGEPFSSIE